MLHDQSTVNIIKEVYVALFMSLFSKQQTYELTHGERKCGHDWARKFVFVKYKNVTRFMLSHTIEPSVIFHSNVCIVICITYKKYSNTLVKTTTNSIQWVIYSNTSQRPPRIKTLAYLHGLSCPSWSFTQNTS